MTYSLAPASSGGRRFGGALRASRVLTIIGLAGALLGCDGESFETGNYRGEERTATAVLLHVETIELRPGEVGRFRPYGNGEPTLAVEDGRTGADLRPGRPGNVRRYRDDQGRVRAIYRRRTRELRATGVGPIWAKLTAPEGS